MLVIGRISPAIPGTTPTGYVRNPDWPAMPTPAAEQFIGLVAVFENRTNRVTMAINGIALVDYGDGTTVNSNGTAQVKTYDYATLAGTSYVDPLTGENYKMVFVTVTRIAANIIDMTFTGIINWLDIAARLPNATLLNWSNNRPMYLCQRVVLHSISGAYNPGGNDRIVQGSLGLRSLTLPWSTFTTGNSVMVLTGEIDDLGNVTAGINLAFSTSRIKRIGTLTVTTAASLAFLCDSMPLIQSIDAIVSATSTNATVMVRNCPRLRGIITINCPALTNITQMAQNSPLVDGFIFTNAAAIATTTSAFDGCYSMGHLEMNGLTLAGISVNGCNFTATNLDLLMTSIGTATGSLTLDLRNNPGSATCTTSIGTGKGWTVLT